MTDSAVRAAQIHTLYDQSGPVLITNVINAVIITITLWHHQPIRTALLVWTGVMTLMSLARLLLRRSYQRANPGPEDAQIWGARFVAGSLVAGLLWGAAGALFFDVAGPLSQVLMTFVIGGMGAGAAGTLSCYLPAFWAYLFPSLVPLLIGVAVVGDPLHLAMAAMIVAYGIGLAFVARNTNRAVTEAFRLRFENETLNRTLEDKVRERTAAFEQQSEALRSAQRMEALGRLAGGVAHDFNNLLTVVLGNSSLLLDEPGLDPASRTAIAEVRDAADRGADLVRQLLAFGRRQRLAPAHLDLNRVVLDMQSLLERLVTEQITLQLDLAPDELFVLVDRSQIEQVLVNLVTNARDATPTGGRIEISTNLVATDGSTNGGAPKGWAVLSISDNGAGMDAETRRRAFEPFFTTKELGRGTGLGLATVYGIADQSGGRIEVTSSPGAGSRFTFSLPLTHAPAPGERSRGREVAPAHRTRATILLAEDDSAVRTATERLLRHMGHNVLPADGGEQALNLARSFSGPIDLLITDLVMGELSGLDLAAKLALERPGLPVLLISGYSWHPTPSVPPDRWPHEFLQKPFSADLLEEKVSFLLARPVVIDGAEAR